MLLTDCVGSTRGGDAYATVSHDRPKLAGTDVTDTTGNEPGVAARPAAFTARSLTKVYGQ